MQETFAIIETGGKQYVVRVGDELRVEKIVSDAGEPYNEGEKIVFDKVLIVDDGKNTTIGTPYIPDAKVSAVSIGEGRAKKITTYRYKSKVRMRKKQGHRQRYTKVKIESIS